jgi:cytochrome c oxidase cbb3-type subunit 1
MLNNPNVPFGNIVIYLQPYLFTRTIAGMLLGIGHIAFATLFVMNLGGWGKQRTGGPTYFSDPPRVRIEEKG